MASENEDVLKSDQAWSKHRSAQEMPNSLKWNEIDLESWEAVHQIGVKQTNSLE